MHLEQMKEYLFPLHCRRERITGFLSTSSKITKCSEVTFQNFLDIFNLLSFPDSFAFAAGSKSRDSREDKSDSRSPLMMSYSVGGSQQTGKLGK